MDLTRTRTALHGIVELLLAGPQYSESGTIRLRVVPGGIRPRRDGRNGRPARWWSRRTAASRPGPRRARCRRPRNALITYLRGHPLSLAETTDLFADLDKATAEAMRRPGG